MDDIKPPEQPTSSPPTGPNPDPNDSPTIEPTPTPAPDPALNIEPNVQPDPAPGLNSAPELGPQAPTQPPETPAMDKPPKKSNKKMMMIVIIIVVVLVVGGAAAYFLTQKDEPAPVATETPTPTQNTPPETSTVDLGNTEKVETQCFSLVVPTEQYAERLNENCQYKSRTFDNFYTDMWIIPDANLNYEQNIKAVTKVGDDAIAGVEAKVAEGSLNEGLLDVIKDEKLPSVKTTKVDGYDATEIIMLDVSAGLRIKFVIIDAPSYKVNGEKILSFGATGFYYNEFFKEAFDSQLDSLRFK